MFCSKLFSLLNNSLLLHICKTWKCFAVIVQHEKRSSNLWCCCSFCEWLWCCCPRITLGTYLAHLKLTLFYISFENFQGDPLPLLAPELPPNSSQLALRGAKVADSCCWLCHDTAYYILQEPHVSVLCRVNLY